MEHVPGHILTLHLNHTNDKYIGGSGQLVDVGNCEWREWNIGKHTRKLRLMSLMETNPFLSWSMDWNLLAYRAFSSLLRSVINA